MIDFIAREPHFADHLLPVYMALPKDKRGAFYCGKRDPRAAARLRAAGVKPIESDPVDSGRVTVCASYLDLKATRAAGRPAVLAEHGAGQSYKGTISGSYIGAPDRDGVVAVLVPGEHAKARHHAAHPEIPAFAIGCPKLDALHAAGPRPMGTDPTIAISFHWNCRVVHETRSAFGAFKPALRTIGSKFNVIGHAHPRMWARVKPVFERFGIEPVEHFTEVIERADVYAVDNSSTLFEFASLDRPVVVMNAPFYRRAVDHGMRFWEFADIGPQADSARKLPRAIDRALIDPPEAAERRREITAQVYGRTDGKASKRAAQALIEIAG